jgi:hypothetical protein
MQLEAGKYWIGDPCYVLDDTGVDFNWSEFVDFIFKGDPSGRLNEGVVQHQGIRFGFFSTAYGDGGYYDNRGNEYGVDAGMIACIPYDLIAPHFTDEDLMSRIDVVSNGQNRAKVMVNFIQRGVETTIAIANKEAVKIHQKLPSYKLQLAPIVSQ